MKITLESTERLVTIEKGGSKIPARVWEGITEGGIPVVALVARVAVKADQDCTEFERDLNETAVPSIEAVRAFPLRLIL